MIVTMLRVAVTLALLMAIAAMPLAASARTVAAGALLRAVPTAVSEPAGYDRDLFDHWVDADGDGCDTRDEVLVVEARTPPGITGRCTIAGGRWWSAYDDLLITSASRLDIDHLVPLAEAWRSGARSWDADTRRAFANDLDYPLSLIAVSASTNRSKGDRDPASWMPGFARYRCTYAASWIAVKWRWSLTVDGVERVALRAALAGCGVAARVPVPSRAPIVAASTPAEDAPEDEVAAEDPADAPVAPTPVETVPPATGADDPRFGTCREAIANGYGPYVRGVDPEYAWYRDADRDGVVCER